MHILKHSKLFILCTVILAISITFINLYATQYDYNTVHIFDKKTIYIGGDHTIFMKTDNGGSTWETSQIASIDTSTDIEAVYFKDKQTGWAVGYKRGFVEKGYILGTTDGGATWETKLGPKNNYPFHEITFKNDLEGWAVGQGDFITRDGGNTWPDDPADFYYGKGYDDIIYDIQFLDENNGWLVTRDHIYRTFNGGSGWTRLTLPNFPFDMRFKSLFFINDQTGWIGGVLNNNAGGVILKIANGGVSITYQIFNDTFYAVWFIDSQTGIAAGSNIYRTTDGGTAWEKITNNEFNTLNDIEFLDDKIGFAVGDDGEIIKTIDGGESWTRDMQVSVYDSYVNNSVVENFSLKQNYPNPFNPETRISYEVAKHTHIVLRVINVQGQHVRTLVNGDKHAGIYEVTWDGRNDYDQKVASGVYFYRLEAMDFIQTRKMVFFQ